MKRALLMIVLQLAANGADAWYTDRNLQRQGFVEHDPVARPFVANRRGLVLWSAAGTAGTLYGEHLLRTHGHGRLADLAAMADVAGHAWGAEYSARHER